MKKNYNFSVTLRCPVCGSTDVDISDDKSFGKCNMCNKEFPDGYDELVELNQANIQEELDEMKAEVKEDAEKYLRESLKKAFKGNKFIKFK